MILRQKTYRLPDLVAVCLKAAPVYTVLQLLSTVVQGLWLSFMTLATANFIDTAIKVKTGELLKSAIYVPIIFVVAMVALNWVSQQLSKFSSKMVTLKLREKLRPALLEKRARLIYEHIENADTWDLISRVTKQPEIEISEGFCGWGGITSAISLIMSIAGVITLLFAHVWWAALVTIGFSVPLTYLAIKGGRASYQAQRDTERDERNCKYLSDTLLGREIAEERALFSLTPFLDEKYASAFKRAYKARFRVNLKWFTRMKLSSIIYSAISVLISLSLLFPTVDNKLSVGMFMSLTIAAFSLVQSMSWQLSNIADNITKKREYLKDFTRLMKLDEDDRACEAPPEKPAAFESLEIKNLRFKYPNTDRYVLDGLSLTVKAGEHAAFVGVNGAGKTTLTKLLTGLYGGYEGEILINGTELRDMKRDELRSLYALVFQDFARYPVSVKDNLAFGIPARENAIGRMGELLGLDEIVAELQNGYDTRLGKLDKDGRELSGGQWQRIAIARALVNPAPVRILDEPTAALDPVAEADIYRTFQTLSRGITTLFISHRLGSTKLSDKVYVLSEGKVAECGSHDELMDKGGLYAEMFEAQRMWYQ